MLHFYKESSEKEHSRTYNILFHGSCVKSAILFEKLFIKATTMSAIEALEDAKIRHGLAESSPNCSACGSSSSEHEVREYDETFRDGRVHCTRCGAFVRFYDAG